MDEHNQYTNFKQAAEAKKREVLTSLGDKATQYEIKLAYTPTDEAFVALLNQKGRPPLVQVHVYSHGWDEGLNFGGAMDPRGRPRPDDKALRQFKAEDFQRVTADWSKDAVVSF